MSDLLDWVEKQDGWVGDCLRRIAESSGHELSDDDFFAVWENVKHAAGIPNANSTVQPLTAEHIKRMSREAPRAVITQIGPVRNIDRLAQNQILRFSPNGITLIYGENGSGKSGYTRIAKRLCRSLKSEELRGNAYDADQPPKSVSVSYKEDGGEIVQLDWEPSTPAPKALQQVSVFDSQNANLYISQGNKIAYLPTELALLEHHGAVCRRIEEKLKQKDKAAHKSVSTPLPAVYTPGSQVFKLIESLNTKAPTLPTEATIFSLAAVSQEETLNLAKLEQELAADPIAMAALRRRAVKLLNRIRIIFLECSSAYSEDAELSLGRARLEAKTASEAVLLSADQKFSAEPITGVGTDSWRVMFDAARKFATQCHDLTFERVPDKHGDLCPLCQEPLSSNGSERMRRFNDFVTGEATKRADAAKAAIQQSLEAIQKAPTPDIDTVRETLVDYERLTSERKAVVEEIVLVLYALSKRRAGMLNGDSEVLALPEMQELGAKLALECKALSEEADEFEKQATHGTVIDEKRKVLAELKDRVMLGKTKDAVVQRLRELSEIRKRKACLNVVASRPISQQITALRKALVSEELKARVAKEIEALDLKHLPLDFTDRSSSGQSLFAVGLESVQKDKAQSILSEGEQRALALACFLAEIGDDGTQYGLIVDDPVSSLDHRRIRQVAKRLVTEAIRGRQVVIFTHNLVFFNEVISEAAKTDGRAPLIKSVVSKSNTEGFGVVHEDREQWIADVNTRLESLKARLIELKSAQDVPSERYRRQVGDFYADLRETWERSVEEVILYKTIQRFDPRVMTTRLSRVEVTDEVYRTVHFAMTKCSERSGHDMAAGRDLPPPDWSELEADLSNLDNFLTEYRRRVKSVERERRLLEAPTKAELY